MEQALFSFPLSELEPLIKSWVKDVLNESQYSNFDASKDQPDQLLTIEEASKLLHLTKPTLYSKVSKGELPGVCKQGKRLYFSKESLIDWIKSGRKKSNAEIEADAETYLKERAGQ